MARVLIVDDKDIMRESLIDAVEAAGHEAVPASGGAEALKRFSPGEVDMVITDLKMPRMDGIELLGKLRGIDATCPVVVITAHGTIATAVEAMKRGAFDYLQKPFKVDQIEMVVDKALAHRRLLAENARLRAELDDTSARRMVGDSPAMQRLNDLVARVAATDSTALIQGETGSGKELVARAIHQGSARRSKPFLTVNCAALSAGLLESELFGHEKGAFTGAHAPRQGRFELADGGTILLDEVTEIDPKLQAKLLRVLQERTFERVGSSETRRADTRVLATTNRDMAQAVADGAFREDLFYRLNVVPVAVPPLRRREGDVPLLAEYFCRAQARKLGVPQKRFDAEAMTALEAHRWPGNVRELENLVERLYVLAPDETITRGDVAPCLGHAGARRESIEPGYVSMAEAERVLIEATLKRFGGHRIKTAEALGIGVRTLGMKLKQWSEEGEPVAADVRG